jgi:hypothetical protein
MGRATLSRSEWRPPASVDTSRANRPESSTIGWRNTVRHLSWLLGLTLVAVVGTTQPSNALFHVVLIDEVLTSYNGSPSDQFVEMRMLLASQNFVKNSVFAAFDSTGAYSGDILVVPDNVTNSGVGTRWLIGTAAFQGDSGLTPDFIMPAGILPTAGGMVCFGGGGGILPQDPPNWDRTKFSNYVDCVAYGSYSGPTNPLIGTPTSLNADGHSLQRAHPNHNNATDFVCADPGAPQNNAGVTKLLAASIPCDAGTATPTPTPPVPTTSVTPSPTSTVTAAPPFNTPTGTPTCAATGTPYCADQCPTPPTARPGCPIPGGPCIQNPQCGPDAICLPLFQCCTCATLTPTRSLIPTASGTPTPTSTLKGTASATPSTTSPPNSPSGTVTVTAVATPILCVGDCDGSTKVTVNELIVLVDIVLGSATPSACPHGIPAGAQVDIAMIVRAVGSALNGCGIS